MKRRDFISGLFAAAIFAGPSFAQSLQDQIIAQLTQQGFTRISINKTLLGRVRIVATSAKYRREIIFNPRTGEILRDYWDDLIDGDAPEAPRISDPDEPVESASGSADDGSDDNSGSSNDDGGSDDTSEDPPDEPDEPDEPDQPDEPDNEEDSSEND